MFSWSPIVEEIKKQKTTQRWVAQKINKRPDLFSRWIVNGVTPDVDTFFQICKVLNVLPEEMVDGEAGRVYVVEWAERNGAKWKPPSKIADIVEDLLALDESELRFARSSIHGLAEDARGKKKDKTEAG
jgi:hypothetical protein